MGKLDMKSFCFYFIVLQIFTTIDVVSSSSLPLNQKEHKINGHLILTSAKNPLAGTPNFTATMSGVFEAALLEILSERLNFTYEMHPPSTMVSGILLQDGSWTGVTGQLQRKEVDMCASTTFPTFESRKVVDSSYPVYFVDTCIVIPFPSESSKSTILITPLNPTVWAIYISSVLFLIVTAWLLNRLTTKNNNRSTSFSSQSHLSYWIFYFFSKISSQGGARFLQNNSSAFRAFCVCSMLSLWLTNCYYICIYTSLLAAPLYKPSVSSIEDLAVSTSLKTLSIKGSSTDNYVVASKGHSALGKIADQLTKYPQRRRTDALRRDDISTVLKNEYGLLFTKPDAMTLIQKSYDLNDRKCKVTLAEKMFWNRPQSYTFVKDSKLPQIFDREILLLQQAGLVDYVEKKAMRDVTKNPCRIFDKKQKVEDDRNPTPLRLKDLIGAFLVLIGGLTLALLAYIVELVHRRIQRKYGHH